MQRRELSRSSVADFLSIVEDEAGNYRSLFRGQSDSRWGLVPGLYRMSCGQIGNPDKNESYNVIENEAIRRFFDEGNPYLPRFVRGYSSDRVLAQHFGVPTRLLDWSGDPLVALFFAVEHFRVETDAAVYVIRPNAKYRPEEVSSIVHEVVALKPPIIDLRIANQKSIFTIHPYGDASQPFVQLDDRPNIGAQVADAEKVRRIFSKIIIPKSFKAQLNRSLSSMGYDRAHLFPGLDGVGSSVCARMKDGSLWD